LVVLLVILHHQSAASPSLGAISAFLPDAVIIVVPVFFGLFG
jgi:F0F1-type ATP synthase assembly protein I